MWAAYCAFYETEVAETVTEGLWRRFFDETAPVKGLLAVDTTTGNPLGFAHYVLHPHTWSDRTLCYLEDLYVRPETRGRSVGYALIEHLKAMGQEQGWGRVYWHTHTNNETARRLYDRFQPADDVVRYTLSL
jgi:GNAT superfamily N-acetyltransferase